MSNDNTEREMTQDDLVELLHLSRIYGSLSTLRAAQRAGNERVQVAKATDEMQRRLYDLLEKLGFDLKWIIEALNKRSVEEAAAQKARSAGAAN